jgi:uncharacterized SAM-binding protein YcdF (DUF218 family)
LALKKNRIRSLGIIVLLIGSVVLLSKPVLTGMGTFLVEETESLHPADAAVVLATGVDYTARLIEAARIYEKGLAKKVVINGDRKSDILKQLEKQGYSEACHWSVNYIGVLKFFNVQERDIIVIDAPDAYDTVSEAAITGAALRKHGLTKLIVTTSRFHTRRAGYIWQTAFAGVFDIQVAAAQDDPFRPDSWWKDGRQVRQVLAEYGAWLYYWGWPR